LSLWETLSNFFFLEEANKSDKWILVTRVETCNLHLWRAKEQATPIFRGLSTFQYGSAFAHFSGDYQVIIIKTDTLFYSGLYFTNNLKAYFNLITLTNDTFCLGDFRNEIKSFENWECTQDDYNNWHFLL
jgi:hypothetical protein